MSRSLVSICIPSYNYARYLSSAIESAVRQTYSEIEVVVVDDGSTDNSLEIAQTYEARYPNLVRVFQHPNGANRGVSATINVSIRRSTGAYWCVMGADDVLQPHKTARQVEFLEQNLAAHFVYSRMAVINGAGELVEGSMGDDITRSPRPLERLLYGNAIPASTVMVRRDAVGTAGLLHDENLLHSDWELWVRLLANGGVGFIDEPLVRYRVHGQNISLNIDPLVSLQHCLDAMTALGERAAEVGGKLREQRVRALIELQRSLLLFKLGRQARSEMALKAAFDADQTLKSDGSYVARWLNGNERDFTRFVVGALRRLGLASRRSLITPRWVYVRSKPLVKSMLGSSLTQYVSRVKGQAQGLRRVG